MTSPAFAASAVPSIEATATAGGISLKGRALALSTGEYDARMKVQKRGASGQTSTVQGGTFALETGETATVATVGLSMDEGDRLNVELILSSHGKEVARSTIDLGR